MRKRNSDLKAKAGRSRSKPISDRATNVSPELVRIALTTLALKNTELRSRGIVLGNRADPIWYQLHLNQIGIKAGLIQVRNNLKRLCRAEVFIQKRDRPDLVGAGESAFIKLAEEPEYVLKPSVLRLLTSKLGLRVSDSRPSGKGSYRPGNSALHDLAVNLKSKLGRQ